MNLEQLQRDSDWKEAFAYAPFSIEDVVKVISSSPGCNDGDNWIGVFLLIDGSYGFLSAGCDYTGWDCQAGGNGEIRDTLYAIVTSVLGQEERERLDLHIKNFFVTGPGDYNTI